MVRRCLIGVLLLVGLVHLQSANARGPTRPSAQGSRFIPALVLNPFTSRWAALAFPGTAIEGQTVVSLPGGFVLVAGGADASGAAVKATFLYDPRATTWRRVGDLHLARRDARGVALGDGGVLLAGGEAPRPHHAFTILTSAERYDPKLGRWKSEPSLPYPIVGQAAARLKNGDVLEVGGVLQGSALQYDVKHNKWLAAATTPIAGVGLSATTLPNGHVLVVGPVIRSPLDQPRHTALMFDPGATSWRPVDPPIPARGWQTATLLAGGRVLVAGGLGGGGLSELYDWTSGRWQTTGTMKTARFQAGATLLASGRVLVAAGMQDDPARPSLIASTEIYNPTTGRWSYGPALPSGQNRRAPTGVLLPGKNVLLLGGTRSAVLPIS